MKREVWEQTLEQVDEQYLSSAAQKKPAGRRPVWVAVTAAVLALSVGVGIFLHYLSRTPDPIELHTPTEGTQAVPPTGTPVKLSAYQLAAPAYPELYNYPSDHRGESYSAWLEDQRTLHNQPKGYADSLDGYFSGLVGQIFATGEGQNISCSPVNVYMALAMLAESTGGDSRAQLLELLGADSIEALREQAGHVWRGHYNNDGVSTSILGSSLWLEEGYPVNEDTAQLLADSYYASVFRGDLGSDEMNAALQSWLNEQTGGLLQEQVQNTKLAPNSTLAIATTIYYQVQWIDRFFEKNSAEGTFHGTSGDSRVTFMNQSLLYNPYYWSDNFGAVYLTLEDYSKLWLFLPDEGVTPESITGEAMAFLAADPGQNPNQKSVIINLSVPKFDISSELDLVSALQNLGVTDVFTPGVADFSPIITTDDGGFVDKVQHASRVALDEDGVTAAAFTVIDRCGAAMPPTDEVDFTLNRPFFFVIESEDGLPLFAGTVNTVDG